MISNTLKVIICYAGLILSGLITIAMLFPIFLHHNLDPTGSYVAAIGVSILLSCLPITSFMLLWSYIQKNHLRLHKSLRLSYILDSKLQNQTKKKKEKKDVQE